MWKKKNFFKTRIKDYASIDSEIVDAEVNFKKFTSLIKIKSNQNAKKLVNDVVPFMQYLKSLIKIENNPNYIESIYTISCCIDGETIIHNIGAFCDKIHEYLFEEIYTELYYNEFVCYNYDICRYIPKEYFKIILTVEHYYQCFITLKNLDHLPIRILSSCWDFYKDMYFNEYRFVDSYNNIKIKLNGNTCIKDILIKFKPFLSSIKSDHKTNNKKKGYKYIKSRFFTKVKTNKKYSYKADFYDYLYSERFIDYSKEVLKGEYVEIIIKGEHQYEKVRFTEELDHCPPNVFKIDQCVICLTSKPNIIYDPCLHFCICDQCDENNLKNCPYCRTKIEKRSIVKNI